ncbi:hypothetical protein pipiens_004292 [Culex pipiens pipiens]|uniref:EGF-like domain-containing protein n=1 Tax=Culex pipiens pipiens TaxID=38569 RepID=A0ABD1CLI8_CULPP
MLTKETMLQSDTLSSVIHSHDFIGCIKDVYLDHRYVDLNSYIADNGTIAGCPQKSASCSSEPCFNGGTCREGWGEGWQCECLDGFSALLHLIANCFSFWCAHPRFPVCFSVFNPWPRHQSCRVVLWVGVRSAKRLCVAEEDGVAIWRRFVNKAVGRQLGAGR